MPAHTHTNALTTPPHTQPTHNPIHSGGQRPHPVQKMLQGLLQGCGRRAGSGACKRPLSSAATAAARACGSGSRCVVVSFCVWCVGVCGIRGWLARSVAVLWCCAVWVLLGEGGASNAHAGVLFNVCTRAHIQTRASHRPTTTTLTAPSPAQPPQPPPLAASPSSPGPRRPTAPPPTTTSAAGTAARGS